MKSPFSARALVPLLLLVGALRAAAGPYAYVANEGSGTVSVIDTSDDQVVVELAIGGKPRGMAITPDGRTAYVSDQTGNRLVVIDLSERRVTGAVVLGRSPAFARADAA